MKAQVVQIRSASEFTDGQRRLTIKFMNRSFLHDCIEVTDLQLGLDGLEPLALDDKLEVSFTRRVNQPSVSPYVGTQQAGQQAIPRDRELSAYQVVSKALNKDYKE
jgi:hypothetical protein